MAGVPSREFALPLHSFLCPNRHLSELFQPLDGLREYEACPVDGCGLQAQKHFFSAPIGRVERIEYRSPIDGRPITTKYGRIEDMARHNCVEYEPGMKDDYLRRQKESQEAIDRKVDAIVEQQIHGMGARKRERLEAELRNGADVAFERSTAGG